MQLKTKFNSALVSIILGLSLLLTSCGVQEDEFLNPSSMLFLSGCYHVSLIPALVINAPIVQPIISDMTMKLTQDGFGNISGFLTSMTVDGFISSFNSAVYGNMFAFDQFNIIIADINLPLVPISLTFELDGQANIDVFRVENPHVASDITGFFITPLIGSGSDFFGILSSPGVCDRV